MRSATLAACTAFLIAGTGTQASAVGTDEPGPSPSHIIVKGDDNNVAGNDLVVGNNHTSGAGHSIGQPQDGLSQATVNVYNCTGKQFTLTNIGENPSTNGEWLSPAATPPSSIASHPATLDGNQCVNYGVSANWTSATTVPVLESDALYNIGGNESETIEFSAIAGRGVPAGVAAACNWSGTSGTCDWISSADVQGDNVRGVVSFIVVPGTTGEV